MYSEEREFEVMTGELATLHDQINIISNSARELSILTNSVFQEQNNDIRSSLEMIKNIESDIENIRKKITSNAVGIEYLMSYKKDVLRIVYIIDKFTGYFIGIIYRLSNIKISILKQAKCDNDIITLIEKVIESIYKLNEMARALSINHRNIIDLTHQIQKLEGDVDSTYRNKLIKTFDGTENTKELILYKELLKQLKKWQTTVKRLLIHSQYLL
jgi:uncharacterized protein Yka (UPF0111/DUF47 family)